MSTNMMDRFSIPVVQWLGKTNLTMTVGDTSDVYVKLDINGKEDIFWNLRLYYCRSVRCGWEENELTIEGYQDHLCNDHADYVEICVMEKGAESETCRYKHALVDQNRHRFQLKLTIDNDASDSVIWVSVYFASESNEKEVLFKDPSFQPFKLMYDQGYLTDVVIKTKEEDFKCHKLVLAARSPYFATMFKALMKESQENEVNWVGIFDQNVVRDLLHFVYTGGEPPNISVTCEPLLEVAHMCLMDDLKNVCVDMLVEKVNPENALLTWKLGERFQSDELQRAALNFIAIDYSDYPETIPGWSDLQLETSRRLTLSLLNFLRFKRIKV